MNSGIGASPAKAAEEQVFTLLEQIQEFYYAFTEGRLGFSALTEKISKLEQCVFSLDENNETAASVLLENVAPKTVAAVNSAYRLWETRLELKFAQRLVQGEAVLSDYPLYKRYEQLVLGELAMLRTLPVHGTLFVGSGPLPVSAIHAHLHTGLPVHCIAADEEAFAVSTQLLAACGLNRSLRVFSGDDTEHDISTYDLVVMEMQANTAKNILKTLRKRCRPGCQILYRTSKGLRQLIYPQMLASSPRGFQVKAWRLAQGEQVISTCLLEPAKSAAADVRLEWVREINPERASQLLRLMNRTLEEESTIGFPAPIDEETGATMMRQLNADVIAKRRYVLVAEKEGMIVGQLILTPNSTPNHHHMVELTRGTIDRSFRGGGLALRAFQEIARKCEELGREVICLDVRAGTMAAIWWQHFGFKSYGYLADYSRVNGKTFAGLYLTQSTTELKQRLGEIVRSLFTKSSN